jgi:hypothetical protein
VVLKAQVKIVHAVTSTARETETVARASYVGTHTWNLEQDY